MDQTTRTINLSEGFGKIIWNGYERIYIIMFPNIRENIRDHQWLSKLAILAAKSVDDINIKIQDMLQGETISFQSIDTVADENEDVHFPTEFLNLLDLPSLPQHNL